MPEFSDVTSVDLTKGNYIWLGYLPDLAKLAEGWEALNKSTESLHVGLDRIAIGIEGAETSWAFVYDSDEDMWYLEVKE